MALVSYRSQNIEDLFGVGRWVKGGGRVESRTRFKRKVLRVNGAEVMPRSQQQQPPSSPSPFLPPVFLTLSSFSPFGSPTLLPLAFPTEARKKEARRYAGVSSPLPRSYTFSSLSLSLSLASFSFPSRTVANNSHRMQLLAELVLLLLSLSPSYLYPRVH